MASLTAIELGADTCALARTAVRRGEVRVFAAEALDPARVPRRRVVHRRRPPGAKDDEAAAPGPGRALGPARGIAPQGRGGQAAARAADQRRVPRRTSRDAVQRAGGARARARAARRGRNLLARDQSRRRRDRRRASRASRLRALVCLGLERRIVGKPGAPAAALLAGLVHLARDQARDGGSAQARHAGERDRHLRQPSRIFAR